MNIFRLIPTIILATLLAGCAASGPKLSEIKSGMPALASGAGRIYVYRNPGMMGGAIRPSVKLNGQEVGDSKPGGFFYVDTTPGPQTVSTSTEVEKTLTFDLPAGETRYVRTTVGFGVIVYRVYPELVDTATGEKELQECAYIGKP